MGFLDTLNQEIAKASTEENNTEYPSKALKHKMKYLGGKNHEIFVRILPPAVHGDNYAKVIREAMMYAVNGSQKVLEPTFTLGEQEDPSSILDQYISLWLSQARMPNRLGGTTAPASRALINVRVIMQNPSTGNWEEEVDEHNVPVTRMLKLPISAYWAINKLLADPRYAPVGSDEYSFISSLTAFPVVIKKGSGNNYEAHPMSNMPMGPLEPGWEGTLEDLNYQATPSIAYNAEFVNYFISVVEGTEGQGGTGTVMTGNPMFPNVAPTAPVVPATPATPVVPATPANSVVPNAPVQGGVPVQPVTPAPVQPVTPAPVQPVTPQQPVQPTPTTPVQSTPVTPVTPEPVQPVTPAPVQPVTPQQPVTPPVQPQPVTPEPTLPVEPVLPPVPEATEQPGTPLPNHKNDALPNVDDLISGM